MQALVRVVDQQEVINGPDQQGPKVMKIAVKCTVKNPSKKGPKTTFDIEKVP
jgi:hypothetical protein